MSVRTTVMVLVALLAVPAFAVAQSEWTDGPVNPVIPPPNPGAWDGHRYTAAVLEVDGTYHLYYLGQLSSSSEIDDVQIGHATSPDGYPPWTIDPANPVIARGDPGEWDDVGAGGGGVIHDGSLFWYWYGGADGQTTRVGYATSGNGSLWTKHGPVIGLEAGPPGSWYDWGMVPGTVIVRDGLYQMWFFAARTVGPDDYDWRVGYAWSEDGMNWNMLPDPVLGPRPGHDRMVVLGLNVVFDGSGYHMWYLTDESTPGAVNIAYAVSPDGIEWIRYPWNPVVGGRSGPCAVLRDQDTGDYTMWYTDQPGFSIRRATSECCPGVFYDGFDFGDTAGWTVTVP